MDALNVCHKTNEVINTFYIFVKYLLCFSIHFNCILEQMNVFLHGTSITDTQ